MTFLDWMVANAHKLDQQTVRGMLEMAWNAGKTDAVPPGANEACALLIEQGYQFNGSTWQHVRRPALDPCAPKEEWPLVDFARASFGTDDNLLQADPLQLLRVLDRYIEYTESLRS